MSDQPDKCPECGAAPCREKIVLARQYECLSIYFINGNFVRDNTCHERSAARKALVRAANKIDSFADDERAIGDLRCANTIETCRDMVLMILTALEDRGMEALEEE